MSKKLIAVASAAALALSALVGVAPASANDVSLVITGGGAEAGTASTTAISVNVPASNTVVWSTASSTTGTALRVVATAAAGASLNITSTGGAAKFLTTTQFDATAPNAATSATGTSSLTGVATGGTFTFYITTTSVDVSTIVVESSSSKVTRFVKGTAGLAYNVTATGPSFVQTAVAADVVVKATDIFGNAVSVGGNQITATYLGGVSENTTATAYRTATRDAVIKVQGTATFGPGSIVVSIADDARRAAADIAGFPTRSFSTFISVNNSNPVTQVAALQAQVTALTAEYNALVSRWNKRVESRKAPKKKLALK
jgi:hypothetical protein